MNTAPCLKKRFSGEAKLTSLRPHCLCQLKLARLANSGICKNRLWVMANSTNGIPVWVLLWCVCGKRYWRKGGTTGQSTLLARLSNVDVYNNVLDLFMQQQLTSDRLRGVGQLVKKLVSALLLCLLPHARTHTHISVINGSKFWSLWAQSSDNALSRFCHNKSSRVYMVCH